jgi:UDP-GlcNAc3NAcA epimerase
VLTEIMVHTGQHFDDSMSAVFFEELGIPEPAYHLDIHGGSHGEMTGRMLPALEAVMVETAPRAVVVYGDTNTTIAAALAAAKLNIPVAHVEAGLRSFNRRMPEEVNRVVADHLSALLLCPTRTAVDNLTREGINEGVHHVGDVMYDASMFAAELAVERSGVLQTLGLPAGGYSVATVHRAENTDDRDALARALVWLRERASDHPVVLPLHPRTRQAVSTHDLSLDGIAVCDPLGYLDMTRLVACADSVYTDSGGLQKEAYFHGVPCITLRSETEWVETIACGWNRLWTEESFAPRRTIDEYGDGDAGQRIVALLEEHYTN